VSSPETFITAVTTVYRTMCADIVTNPVFQSRPRFKFPGKNGIVRQSLHCSINDKKQFFYRKITIWIRAIQQARSL